MAQRILIADDDREIVRLVRAYLEKNGYQVLVAYDGSEALQLLRSERPDLLVLDLMLPKLDGWAVTRTLRSDAHLAGTPILMLTARVDDEDKVLGLELGADDYVTKPFNAREVVARVRALLRRAQEGQVQPKVIQLGPLRLDMDRHDVSFGERPIALTPTEFDLLRLLAEHPDHVLSRSELIESGAGYAYEGLERTVDSHIKNLRRKLDQAGGAGLGATLIETVFGIGYRLRSQGPWTERSS